VGLSKTILRIFIIGISLITLLVVGELAIRWLAPQEIFGWGERASLEPDDQFGWRLIPSKETRLRWLSYDYVVSANELGFPGPEFPVDKPAGSYRILVTGDAFTSAEGVDTNQAWPRLLQTGLGNNVEVLNFAITGYGPNQYAEVVDKFTPIYKPDLIIVELFVNDFFDAQTSDQKFQEYIGFNQPDQNGLYSIIRLEHLRRFFRINFAEPSGELILNKPNATGYFLGNFASFEKDQVEQIVLGSQQINEKLRQIQNVAEHNKSKLMLIMVPASIQVCQPSQLDYFPKNIDFGNKSIYDSELPQRAFIQIADGLWSQNRST
jgi:hypothetical protein